MHGARCTRCSCIVGSKDSCKDKETKIEVKVLFMDQNVMLYITCLATFKSKYSSDRQTSSFHR